MNCHVIHENTTLLHHVFDVPKAQRVSYVLAHASEHDLKRVVQPFEVFAQGAVDEALAEIEHGQDCRLRLLQQNQNSGLRRAQVAAASLRKFKPIRP